MLVINNNLVDFRYFLNTSIKSLLLVVLGLSFKNRAARFALHKLCLSTKIPDSCVYATFLSKLNKVKCSSKVVSTKTPYSKVSISSSLGICNSSIGNDSLLLTDSLELCISGLHNYQS